MKKCKKCGIEKSLTEFGKRTASKDGLMYNCKQCKKEEYENNKEKRKDYLEQYRKRPEVKERKKKYNKDYKSKNLDKIKAKRKEHYEKNK